MATKCEPFCVLNPGRTVTMKPEWRKIMGFTQGKILGLCENVTIEQAIVDGGTYRIRPLDGRLDNLWRIYDMHRATFVPVGKSIGARTKRKNAIAKVGA